MRLAGAVFVLLAAAGCSMVESDQIKPFGEIFAANALACSNSAGFYYLPKTVLRVEVLAENKRNAQGTGTDPTKPAEWHAVRVQQRRVPDTRFGYCLDYLRSATSDDIVKVAKYNHSPILALVASRAVDQSGYIMSTLIQTLFVGLSGNPNFAPSNATTRSFWQGANAVKVFTAEFDPFDPRESARINQGLKDYGFCLLLGGHMFNMRAARIDSYCDEPRSVFASAPVDKLEYIHTYARVEGIYYRPRIPYNLYLFVKKNPLKSHGRYLVAGGWELRKTTPVALENIAPVVSIGVQRTYFAQRHTTLVFEEGALKDACISKTSEMVEFAKIPLQVTQSVVALPANIIQVRINNISSDANLVEAENDLIREQAKYLQELSDPVKQAGNAYTLDSPDAKDAGNTGLNSAVALNDNGQWHSRGDWAQKLVPLDANNNSNAVWGGDARLATLCNRETPLAAAAQVNPFPATVIEAP